MDNYKYHSPEDTPGGVNTDHYFTPPEMSTTVAVVVSQLACVRIRGAAGAAGAVGAVVLADDVVDAVDSTERAPSGFLSLMT